MNDGDLFQAPAENPTTVVNVTDPKAVFDVYIGRAVPARGFREASPWANPFKIEREADRAAAVAKYEKWLDTQPELLAMLPDLKGKRLGCWCAPKACHGHILARRADGLPSRPIDRLEAEMTRRRRGGWRMIKDELDRPYRWNERVEFLKWHKLIPDTVTEWEQITQEQAEAVLERFAEAKIWADKLYANACRARQA